MALTNDDLAKAEALLNELPGIQSAIQGADNLTDDQLEGLLHLVEAASEAMSYEDGSEAQGKLVDELIRIDDTIQGKLHPDQKEEEGE